jgi:hypothetical protein
MTPPVNVADPSGSPPDGPATLATVATQLGLDPANLTPAETARLDPIVAAVNDEVRRMPVVTRENLTPTSEWPPGVVLGASMLGARLFARKNSPAGVQSFADGAALYVQRNDPDIAQLLKLGRWTIPAVG